LRRVQLELDASRSRYIDLYDLAPVGYLTVNEHGLILEANLTSATLLGVARAELVGQPFSRFVCRDTSDSDYLHRSQLVATREPQAYDLRMVKQDGAEFSVHVSATASQDGAGAPLCRMTLSDITDRKQAEDARRETDERFRFVFDHSALGQSITMPSGEVEVNTALCDVLGYSGDELRHKHWRDVTHPEDVELTQREVDAVLSGEKTSTRFIKRFLRRDGSVIWADLSSTVRRDRTEMPMQLMTAVLDITARKQAEAEKAALQAQLQQAQKMESVGRLAGEDIHLAWQPGVDIWPVKVDASQMEQILVNLCVNARDAIGGVGTITIATRNTVDDADWADVAGRVPGECVRLEVSDTGCGMDAETLSHIFEPFFTTKGVGEGIGMGLASVLGSVEQNGGVIQVQSVRGAGTTFRIYLPRHAATVAASDAEGAAAHLSINHALPTA
jgi:PAS domain S-box-containing protein